MLAGACDLPEVAPGTAQPIRRGGATRYVDAPGRRSFCSDGNNSPTASRLAVLGVWGGGRGAIVTGARREQRSTTSAATIAGACARRSCRDDMLHPKLRGKPYTDFANGHPTSAIQEAYKIVDIEVGKVAKITSTYGVNLMLQAFDQDKGPLTDMTENEPTRRALARLFAGAMGRFRNSSTHTHRAFHDLHEAIEELMVASRLLRFLDEPGRA